MKPVALVTIVVLIGASLLLWFVGSHDPVPVSGPFLESFLDPDVEGFAQVTEGARLDFPADHGAHPGFRSELWNLFGRLEDEQGNDYAFQLDLTRVSLNPHEPDRASAWAANEVYRGRLTLVQGRGTAVRSAERVTRAALGLAGSRPQAHSVWVEDWSLTFTDGEMGRSRMALVTAGDGAVLDLDLAAIKSPIPFSDLTLLGRDSGGLGLQAYLLPRMAAIGTLSLDGDARPVQGYAWLDHAWGAIPMSRGQVGLNRFAIQLDDDRELICLQLRREDGTGTPIPACALILADGRVQSFRRREIQLEPTAQWRSPRTGSRYSVAWRLAIPILDLELELSPMVQDQESAGAIRLWSGAVQAMGRQGSETIGGRGRIETTGDQVESSGAR
jgi:predicted secreted hydrolase